MLSSARIGRALCFAFFTAGALVTSLLAAPDNETLSDGVFTKEEMAQGFSNQKIIAMPRTPAGLEHNAAAESALLSMEANEGFVVEQTFTQFGGMRVIMVPDGLTSAAACAQLQATGRYDFVQHDYILETAATPNDPDFVDGTQWHLRNNGQSPSALISTPSPLGTSGPVPPM